jgi:deoxyribonuclease-4
MVRAADRAAEIGASALQVFSDNPTSWRRRPALPRELPAFLDRLAVHGLAPLAIHAPYLVNLAAPDASIRERSVAVLVNELRVAAAYGASFVNVHIGSHRGDGFAVGLDRLVAGISQVFEELDGAAPGPALILENGAGGGFAMGATVEELGQIAAALAAAGIPGDRSGFCLDTAHAWAAGYPIDTPAGVDATLAELDRAVGLPHLRMVHLNDSRSERGSRADRHEHIGAGRIGAGGIGRILSHPGLDHVTYYLETPAMDAGYDAINVRRVLDIAAGRPLATLPPEAFAARAEKGRSAPREDDDEAVAAKPDGAPNRERVPGRTPRGTR